MPESTSTYLYLISQEMKLSFESIHSLVLKCVAFGLNITE